MEDHYYYLIHVHHTLLLLLLNKFWMNQIMSRYGNLRCPPHCYCHSSATFPCRAREMRNNWNENETFLSDESTVLIVHLSDVVSSWASHLPLDILILVMPCLTVRFTPFQFISAFWSWFHSETLRETNIWLEMSVHISRSIVSSASASSHSYGKLQRS